MELNSSKNTQAALDTQRFAASSFVIVEMEENINNGVEEQESANHEPTSVPVLNPSIPSGEQTVWADVASLLDSACNGNNRHSLRNPRFAFQHEEQL